MTDGLEIVCSQRVVMGICLNKGGWVGRDIQRWSEHPYPHKRVESITKNGEAVKIYLAAFTVEAIDEIWETYQTHASILLR